MLGALLYLRFTSLKNLLRSRLRRLRQPKYLVGAIVGIAYFYFLVFRNARRPGRAPTFLAAAGLSHESITLMIALGAVALLTVLVFMWVLPSQKPGLPFTEAETAFLFPAPVTRRMLIHYKLLNTQFAVLLQSVLFAAIFNNRSLVDGQAVRVLVGWWLILTLVSLHYMGASLTVTRLIERGVSPARRRGVVLGVIALAVGATLALVWRDLRAPAGADLAGIDAIARWLLPILDGGALHWLLLPCRLVLRPFFAEGPRAFLLALGPALLLLAAHYFWVARLEVSFEEASIARAGKRAARLAALQAGTLPGGPVTRKARRPPFALAATGRPEIAFLWKNLLSAPAFLTPRVWLVCAGVIVVGARLLAGMGPAQRGTLAVAGFAGFAVGAYVLLLGPLLARIDLRRDLANADLLKTYPLPGWRIVFGEILAPVALLTGVAWLALLAVACAFHPAGASRWSAPGVQLVLLLCAAALVPALLALQMLIPNATAILFPGWTRNVRTTGGGIDLMGQRLIFVFGQIFVILLALLPAAATAGLLVFATQWLIGPAAALLFATLVILAVIGGEVWCGLWWLGERFERLDLSTELQP